MKYRKIPWNIAKYRMNFRQIFVNRFVKSMVPGAGPSGNRQKSTGCLSGLWYEPELLWSEKRKLLKMYLKRHINVTVYVFLFLFRYNTMIMLMKWQVRKYKSDLHKSFDIIKGRDNRSRWDDVDILRQCIRFE